MHSLQFYFHELKGNLTDSETFLLSCLGSEGQRASGPQDSIHQAGAISRDVLVSGVAWDGSSDIVLVLCTPNSSGLSGYHQDSVLGKATLGLHRVNLLLGIHA